MWYWIFFYLGGKCIIELFFKWYLIICYVVFSFILKVRILGDLKDIFLYFFCGNGNGLVFFDFIFIICMVFKVSVVIFIWFGDYVKFK